MHHNAPLPRNRKLDRRSVSGYTWFDEPHWAVLEVCSRTSKQTNMAARLATLLCYENSSLKCSWKHLRWEISDAFIESVIILVWQRLVLKFVHEFPVWTMDLHNVSRIPLHANEAWPTLMPRLSNRTATRTYCTASHIDNEREVWNDGPWKCTI